MKKSGSFRAWSRWRFLTTVCLDSEIGLKEFTETRTSKDFALPSLLVASPPPTRAFNPLGIYQSAKHAALAEPKAVEKAANLIILSNICSGKNKQLRNPLVFVSADIKWHLMSTESHIFPPKSHSCSYMNGIFFLKKYLLHIFVDRQQQAERACNSEKLDFRGISFNSICGRTAINVVMVFWTRKILICGRLETLGRSESF